MLNGILGLMTGSQQFGGIRGQIVMGVRLRQWLVLIGVTAAFCHHKIHHLAMMVMMYPYGYHRQKDGQGGHEYGQSLFHSATKIQRLS